MFVVHVVLFESVPSVVTSQRPECFSQWLSLSPYSQLGRQLQGGLLQLTAPDSESHCIGGLRSHSTGASGYSKG